jgi:hypothetical protein
MSRRRYVESAAILSLLFAGPDSLHTCGGDAFPVVRRRRRFLRRPG